MRHVRIGGALVVVALWAILISARVTEWQNPILLWGSAVRHAPLRARPQVNLAVALADQGFRTTALMDFQRIADRSDDLAAAAVARRNAQRLQVREQDLNAWFHGDLTANLLLSSALR